MTRLPAFRLFLCYTLGALAILQWVGIPAASGAPAKTAPAAKKHTAPAAKKVSKADPEAARIWDPNLFTGRVKTGYAYARANPPLTRKLFCYCGCDITEQHKTLLDCYTDKNKHAADCKECIDELIIATEMLKKGQPMSAVYVALHKKFAPYYPWNEATEAYSNYLKTAQLKFVKSDLAEPLPSQSPNPVAPAAGQGDATSKPGCCEHDEKPGTDDKDKKEKAPAADESSKTDAADKKANKPKFDFPPEGPKLLADDAVKKYPDLISQLPCFCGCEKAVEHTSLIDCFTSNESPECSVCLEEAAIAGKMHADGATNEAIKKVLTQMYK